MYKLTYNQNKHIVALSALEMLPKLKDGKSDVGVFVSFYSDFLIWLKFKRVLFNADDKKEILVLIDTWNKFFDCREADNYCLHTNSEHSKFYKEIFN